MLRYLEGYCNEWVNKIEPKLNPRVCFIDYDYTRFLLKKFQIEDSTKLYIGWDRDREDEYMSFQNFGNRMIDNPPDNFDVLHDAWILTKSTYFIPNFASTLDFVVSHW